MKLTNVKSDSVKFTILILMSAGTAIFSFFMWMLIVGDSISNDAVHVIILKQIAIIYLVIFISVVTVSYDDSSLLVESSYIDTLGRSLLVTLAVTILIFYYTTGLGKVTSTIARNIGVGGIENTRIVVSVTGMNSKEFFGNACDQKNEFCTIDNVDILWGRGDRYLLRIGRNETSDANTNSENVTQPKEKQIIFPEDRILLIER